VYGINGLSGAMRGMRSSGRKTTAANRKDKNKTGSLIDLYVMRFMLIFNGYKTLKSKIL